MYRTLAWGVTAVPNTIFEKSVSTESSIVTGEVEFETVLLPLPVRFTSFTRLLGPQIMQDHIWKDLKNFEMA